MKNYKFSFVILHYLAIEDTLECIDSIINNVEYDNYNIVVVDNGSNNGTGEALIDKYRHTDNIKVIINKENLGFAKGNNIGFRFAKYKLKSNFICMINNDTIIKQNSFIEKIIEIYKREKFDVLGPDIISLIDKQHQNPQRIDNGIDKKWINKWILRNWILLVLNKSGLEDKIRKLKKSQNNIFVDNKNIDHKKQYENIQLHGSCLIFAPNYISLYEGLYDKTFMYMEEDILFYLCKKNNLKTLYSPDITIFHKEDSATNKLLKKDYMKRRFIYENTLKSSLIMRKLM